MKKDWVVSTQGDFDDVINTLGRFKISRAVRVTVEHYNATRSNEQNAKYWACLSEAAKHIGCSSEELHDEMLCQHFGAEEYRMPGGQIRRVPRQRSSALDKREFSEYLDFTINFLNAELGMELV